MGAAGGPDGLKNGAVGVRMKVGMKILPVGLRGSR